jgi:hypothetical protein
MRDVNVEFGVGLSKKSILGYLCHSALDAESIKNNNLWIPTFQAVTEWVKSLEVSS